MFFDGSNDELEEIFPSIEGMKAENLRDAGIDVSLAEGDNGNLDELAVPKKYKTTEPLRREILSPPSLSH